MHNLGCLTLWELKTPQEHGELGRDELMSMASDKLTTAGPAPHMQGFKDAGTLDAVSGSAGPAECSGVHDKVVIEPEVRQIDASGVVMPILPSSKRRYMTEPSLGQQRDARLQRLDQHVESSGLSSPDAWWPEKLPWTC
jgi:hypothetical protein